MASEENLNQPEHKTKKITVQNNSSDSVYAMGLIGAWVYYFKRAKTNQERLQGFFKGLAWPAILVYELLGFFNKE